jgi:DNA-binding winged helix-turn-helix (wHTH) protein/tetratricopeptide (TPR) repeat protein
MLFGFGSFELDLATCELRREGRVVPLQPRVFGILRYLVEHRDRVVGKQELIDALWGGHQLNAVAVPWTINRARKALGTKPSAQGLIETIRGHGYRFVADVQALDDGSGVSSSRPPRTSQPESAQRVDSPFVGREPIMQQLTAALDAAGEDRGALYLLTGEAGIGKTRCATELAVLARRRGLQVWLGRCFEGGAAPAFWPFIQVLRAACNDPSLSESLRRDGERLLQEFVPHAPNANDREHTPAIGDARFWLLDRLSRWLCRSARLQVRLVELEDVHCADESSLQALAMLAPLLAQSRMLVVATARDAGGGEAERSVPGLTTRLRPCEHVALRGLQIADVELYLAATLGDELAFQLSRTLSARTAGNPLFVREVARAVQAQRSAHSELRIEDVQLPQAVKEIISARFLALDATTCAILDVACVIGEEFTLPVLTRVCRLDAEAVLLALQAAVQANIIEPKRDGSKHAFVHPLMREVLYASLASARRASLHAAVGLALEAFGLIEPPLNELAYHFHHAPIDPYYERAVHYGRLAGEAAMRVLAYDEAVQFYAWALEADPHRTPRSVAETCELLLLRVAALALAARIVEARHQCERAIELARAENLPEILVRAARLLRPSVWLAQLPNPLAVETLEDALARLPETASATRAYAYAQLASLPPYSLKLELSAKMSAEAVRLASHSNDVTLQLEARSSRLFGLSGPDTIDELLQVADETSELDPKRASAWRADAQLARYNALLKRGDTAAADRTLHDYARIARELRVRPRTWHCERLIAQRVFAAGRLKEAERLFDELWAEGKRMRLLFSYASHRAHEYALNFERTGRRLCSNFEPPEVAGWVKALPAYRSHRILLAIELGELAEASRDLRALSADNFAAVTCDPHSLFSLSQLTLAAASLNDLHVARMLRALLEPYAKLLVYSSFTLPAGCVSRYLGILENLLGRRSHARRYFEFAIEVNGRTGNELERMRASLALAECLAEARSDADRDRARAIVAAVAATGDACGAHALHASALAIDARLGRPACRTSAAATAKTPRRRPSSTKLARSR